MPAGLVLAAMAGLWIAYLVPHWLRHRQQLLESRTDDRFSERLRVIRVARGHTADRSAEQRDAPLSQVVLHPALRGGRPMDRPHATGDRAAADAARRRAAVHAHRTAERAKRAARARRRAVLAAMLLVASAAGWSAVGVGLTIAAGAVPSALLLVVLVLGRRAARAGQRQAGSRRAATETASSLGTGRTARGRAIHPSDAVTEEMARVAGAQSELSRPRAEQVAADTDGWVPVPVPVPAYTLKPAVQRADPPPLVLDDSGSAPIDAPVAAEEAPPSTEIGRASCRERV